MSSYDRRSKNHGILKFYSYVPKKITIKIKLSISDFRLVNNVKAFNCSKTKNKVTPISPKGDHLGFKKLLEYNTETLNIHKIGF